MSERRKAIMNLGLNGLGLVRKCGDHAVTVDGRVLKNETFQGILNDFEFSAL